MASCVRGWKKVIEINPRDQVARADLHAKRPFLKLRRENKKNSSSRDDCRSIHPRQRAIGNPHPREPPPTPLLLLSPLLPLLVQPPGRNLGALIGLEEFAYGLSFKYFRSVDVR